MKPVEILLVEDSAGDALLIRQTLAEEPYPVTVHHAVDGEQAIGMMEERRFQPDLIILDLNLPKVSGLAFLRRAKPDVPVVVFTSSSDPHERHWAFELGVKDFIEKPMDLREYKRQVSQMVRNWGMAAVAA